MFDVENNKTLSATELMTVLKSLGQNPHEVEVAKMIQDADDDCTGVIDFFGFCNLMAKRIHIKYP